MRTRVLLSQTQYKKLKRHLFNDDSEQGAFLFARRKQKRDMLDFVIDEIYFVPTDRWRFRNAGYLELEEKEKVKIMLKAREIGADVLECHSHVSSTKASFSFFDLEEMQKFIQYVWWKLPEKIYGALVWSRKDVNGVIWLPKQYEPITIESVEVQGHRIFSWIRKIFGLEKE